MPLLVAASALRLSTPAIASPPLRRSFCQWLLMASDARENLAPSQECGRGPRPRAQDARLNDGRALRLGHPWLMPGLTVAVAGRVARRPARSGFLVAQFDVQVKEWRGSRECGTRVL